MPNVKMIDVVSAIHKKVREQPVSYDDPAAIEDWSNDLAKLHSAYNAAYTTRNIVGTVPQIPNKLLALVAGWVIAITQRVLIWYTTQILRFHEASAATLNRICSLQDRNFRAFLTMATRIESLEREMRLLRMSQSTPAAPVAGADRASLGLKNETPAAEGTHTRAPIDTEDFYFKLQGKFQSSGPEIVSQLEMYRSLIGNLNPKIPEGPWLDIGCGRGKWLNLAREAGYAAAGVDSNRAAVEQCCEAGFDATEADGLDFLRAAESASFSVITAFHVLEHLPFQYCLNLVWQAARALKPGGIFLIETPHPGNLLMAAEQFWMDPTHNRPIPIPLMEFLFQYCGFRVVHCFEIHPRPESEHLPWRELELANRLDRLLYGPQDYAMVGRREPF
jgi:SAM-dependent methyltransferase